MESRPFSGLVPSILKSLEDVSLVTEEVYGRIGRNFPAMLKELDSSFGVQGSQTDFLQKTDSIFQGIQSYEILVEKFQEQGRQLLTDWHEKMGLMKVLGSNVMEIRDDSVQMELLSLNAIVIAIKVGEAGRAFACITTELKQLSGKSMTLTESILRREQSLNSVFQSFNDAFSQGEHLERESFSLFHEQIQRALEQQKTTATEMFRRCDEISSAVASIKQPLVKTMVEIQNQDRIRQSIDHVLVSLKEFQNTEESQSIQERLDNLSYLEILPDLGIQVLNDVAEQIFNNRAVLKQSLGQAKVLVERLENQRESFLGEFFPTQGRDFFGEIFASIGKLYEGFLGETIVLMRQRERLVRQGTGLQLNVTEMVGFLREFVGLSSWFRNIDIASRIQVARQSELIAMRDNATTMTNLTVKIGTDVSLATETASRFLTSAEALFRQFQTLFKERLDGSTQFIEQNRSVVAELRTIQNSLKEAFHGSRVFTTAFVDLFVTTEQDLANLDQLLEAIVNQKDSLKVLKLNVINEKKKLLDSAQISEWKLENHKLKEMISRFTIFTHKKIAADLANFEIGREVTQEVATGELTLF